MQMLAERMIWLADYTNLMPFIYRIDFIGNDRRAIALKRICNYDELDTTKRSDLNLCLISVLILRIRPDCFGRIYIITGN
jgi:hypothetical protein